jgi:hypothetical protein
MGCGCGKNKEGGVLQSVGNVVKNMTTAMISQPKKLKWFKDGLSGLYKCIGVEHQRPEQEIIENRAICTQCEFATNKKDGKLTLTSQCMGIGESGSPCGCFILCKTQNLNEKCPLNKWGVKTELTVKTT